MAQFGFAQMGGGMGFGGGTGTGTGMGPGRMGGGIGFGMGSIMTGLVVGPDGTAYLLRGGTSTTTGTGFGMMQFGGSATLIAVNPNGTTNWKAQVDGSIVSQPVVSGNQIYLTTSEPPVLGSTSTRQPAFVIFSTSGTQVKRVNIAADMLSVPVASPDGKTIYVIAVDMPDLNTSGVAGSSTLYAYDPTGTEKFHIAVSQL